MKLRNNLIWIAILILVMIIVTIIAIVTIIVIAFKIHILVGIFALCAVIYWICRKLLYII